LFAWLKGVSAQRYAYTNTGKVGFVVSAVFRADHLLRSAVCQRHMGACSLDLRLDVIGQRAWQVLDAGGNLGGLGGGQRVAVKQYNNGAAIGQRGQLLRGLLAAGGFRQRQVVGGDAAYRFSVGDKREHGIYLSGWLTGGAGWRCAGHGR